MGVGLCEYSAQRPFSEAGIFSESNMVGIVSFVDAPAETLVDECREYGLQCSIINCAWFIWRAYRAVSSFGEYLQLWSLYCFECRSCWGPDRFGILLHDRNTISDEGTKGARAIGLLSSHLFPFTSCPQLKYQSIIRFLILSSTKRCCWSNGLILLYHLCSSNTRWKIIERETMRKILTLFGCFAWYKSD